MTFYNIIGCITGFSLLVVNSIICFGEILKFAVEWVNDSDEHEPLFGWLQKIDFSWGFFDDMIGGLTENPPTCVLVWAFGVIICWFSGMAWPVALTAIIVIGTMRTLRWATRFKKKVDKFTEE